MSLLDHPHAQALLADAEVAPDAVQGCQEHLQGYLQRSLPLFARQEQRGHAGADVRGLLSGLERKSIEPIAAQAGIPRKNLQYFVGAGAWDDEALTAELRQHVAEELGDPEGILVLDPSGVPKKGKDSCGVARQWCGRLGKKDNCQIGVFLASVSAKGHAPLEARLSLPKAWTADRKRRKAAHVPKDVRSRSTWQIAHELRRRTGSQIPHRWVVGDDQFGRASQFRDRLRRDHERDILDVPCNTTVRELNRRRPPPPQRPPQPQACGPLRAGRGLGRGLACGPRDPLDRPRGQSRSHGGGGGHDPGLCQVGPSAWSGGAVAGAAHVGSGIEDHLCPEQRPRVDPFGRVGPGARATPPGRAGLARGQGGGGSGS